MIAIDSTTQSKTAELAYFLFLERQRHGLPGSEHDDWLRAEEQLRNHPAPPAAKNDDHKKVKTTANPHFSNEISACMIKGIGPRVAADLKAVGITTCGQLALWNLSDFGEKLPRLTARARNGEWIEQARKLAGDS
jgi:predicted flap endonuclease-1-like 5' DNA nuclease